MHLTQGAVKALRKGAQRGPECNAVTEDGVCLAPQLDPNLDEFEEIIHFQPVLEVKRTEWHGKLLSPCPHVKFFCGDADGDDEIIVMASNREKHKFAKKFFSKNGPFHQGRMKPGRRFKLLQFTTDVAKKDWVNEGGEEIVRLEKIRCEPIKRKQTKIKNFLAANNQRLQGNMQRDDGDEESNSESE